MRARVGDGIFGVVIGMMKDIVGVGEAELQNSHRRKANLLAQLVNFFGDHPQVFGDDGQFAKFFPRGLEWFFLRPRLPLPADRRFSIGRELPSKIRIRESDPLVINRTAAARV